MICFVNDKEHTEWTGWTGQRWGKADGRNIQHIVMAQADGEELGRALWMLNRQTRNKIGYFFGDEARFLAANWS
jgi:hypothetical protein